MDNQFKLKLKRMIVKHEGVKQKAYIEKGIIHIGAGRNLLDRGISLDEVNILLENDIEYFHNVLSNKFPWFADLSDNRKIALIDMCFNVGFTNFLKFTHMLEALAKGNYAKAGFEMMSSKWNDQNPHRVRELADIITHDIFSADLPSQLDKYNS